MQKKACNSPCSETLALTVETLRTCEDSPILLACTHSFEGILAAVGLGYLAHLGNTQMRLCDRDCCQPQLGEQVIGMPDTNDAVAELAERVLKGLERTVSAGCTLARHGSCPGGCDAACARRVIYACANDAPEVPEAVHRYVRLAFEKGPAIRTMQTDPTVAKLAQLASFTIGECERTRQFVRFKHMADGSFFASFSPAANTLPFTASYFVGRNREDRFCVVDPVHRIALVHEAQARRAQCVLLDEALATELASRSDFASDEAYVQAMWQKLYHALTLEGRTKEDRGYDLQAKFIPKRLRAGLIEMAPSTEEGLLAIPTRYAG